jgi:hypothetical protein
MENLPNGNIRIRDIDIEEVTSRIHAAAQADQLLSTFPFRSVPDKERDHKFKEVLAHLKTAHSIDVPSKTFFTEHTPDDGGPKTYFPNAAQFATIGQDLSMIIMSTSYQMGTKADRTEANPLGFKIAENGVSFRLLEFVGD